MLKLLQYLAVPCLAMVSVSLYAAPAANFVCPKEIVCVFEYSHRGTCTMPAGLDANWSFLTFSTGMVTNAGKPIALPFSAASSGSQVTCIYYDKNQGEEAYIYTTNVGGNYTPVGSAWQKQSDGWGCGDGSSNLACTFNKK